MHSKCEGRRKERGWAVRRAMELARIGPYAEQRGLAKLWVEEDLGPLALGRVERQEGPVVRVSDLEPELGLWDRELILCCLLLPPHLSFQEGMTPTVGW